MLTFNGFAVAAHVGTQAANISYIGLQVITRDGEETAGRNCADHDIPHHATLAPTTPLTPNRWSLSTRNHLVLRVL